MEPLRGIEPRSPNYENGASPQCLKGGYSGAVRPACYDTGPTLPEKDHPTHRAGISETGIPGRIRTCNIKYRRLVAYPVGLRGLGGDDRIRTYNARGLNPPPLPIGLHPRKRTHSGTRQRVRVNLNLMAKCENMGAV